VPGIGKKFAEKMVLELRDRIGPVGAGTPAFAAPLAAAWHVQVREGLIGLGWTPAQAEQAVATVAEGVGDDPPPVPVLLKQAIRLLGTNR
jgi:Holliday junction DNA helicase RuvA